MPKVDNKAFELALIAIATLAVVMQAIVLLAIFFALRKAFANIRNEIADLRASVTPVVESSREVIDNSRLIVDYARKLFARVAPKAEAMVGDAARIAHVLREQTEEAESTTKEILERTRRQTERLDAMTTDALDAVDRAGSYVTQTVVRPVRQIAGLAAAAKAIIESLRGSAREPRRARYSGDEDTFI